VHAVYGNFPYVLAFVLVLTLILLARAFRSIVLPIKAAFLILVSLAGAFGIVVFSSRTATGPPSGTSTRRTRSRPGSR